MIVLAPAISSCGSCHHSASRVPTVWSASWPRASPAEDNQPLDYRGALSALGLCFPRGERLVYGEGIWSTTPTPEAAAPLAARLDEFVSLAQLVDIAVASGFQSLRVSEATTVEGGDFETGFAARLWHWLRENPDHDDAGEVRARAAPQRGAYFDGNRNVMGMAYLGLIAV